MFEITTEYGQFYYDLFYFIALFFYGLFFFIDGKRKKRPLAEWSLIFFSGLVFFVIGSKLFTYSLRDLQEVLSAFSFPFTLRKTVMGGILGAVFGTWIAVILLRFPYPVLDSFAVSFPVAMAIQRIGCFIAGCCFGSPTDAPWAVRYSYNALAYQAHLDHGLISETSSMSLPVHPTQLYQILLCLLIAFVVWKLRNRFRRPGNLFFASIALYMIARFVVEFWTDSAFYRIKNVEWMEIKYLQWALLGALLLITTLIIVRERMFKQNNQVVFFRVNSVWYFIFLCVLVLIARNWFTKTEFLFIELVFIPVSILYINKIRKQYSSGSQYGLSSVFALVFVLILSGTVTAQKVYQELKREESSKKSYYDVSIGYGHSEYYHFHSKSAVHGCDETYYEGSGQKYLNKSNVFGGGISYTQALEKHKKLTYIGELSGGWNTEENATPTKRIGLFDIAPYIKFDNKWYGIGFGAHGGMSVLEEEVSNGYFSRRNMSTGYIGIAFNLRILPYEYFYTEIRYNSMFPYQIGSRSNNAFQLLLGSGFGMTDGSGLKVGLDLYAGYFMSGNLMLKNRYGLTSTYYFGGKSITNHPHDPNNLFQISVTYRFNQKH